MIKHRILNIAVVFLLCGSLPVYAIRPVYTEKQKQALKAREALHKLGSGDVRVAVVTQDGRTIVGRLGSIRDAEVGIINPQQGTITNVNLEDVAESTPTISPPGRVSE